MTRMPSLSVQKGVTFHLDAYRSVIGFFHAPSSAKETVTLENHANVAIVLRNAHNTSDRLGIVEGLLKNNGWAVQGKEEGRGGDQLTTLAAKESNEKEAAIIQTLLLGNGFVAVRGAPLPKEEKFDILITVGAY